MSIKYRCRKSSIDKRVESEKNRLKRLERQLKKEYSMKKKRATSQTIHKH